MLLAAQHLGIENARVLERAGITQEDIPPSPGRMAWDALRPLVTAALELTGEPALGLLAGRLGSVHVHGIAGAYLVHLSPARVSQLFAYEQVWPRVSNMVRFYHQDDGDRVFNRGEAYAPVDPLVEPLMHVFIANHVAAYRGIFGSHAEIDHVALKSTTAGDAAHLSELMGCRVLTGQAGDWVCVPKELVERPMPLADPWLRAKLQPQIEAFFRMLDEKKDTTIAVRTALEKALMSGTPVTLPAIAATLGWKPRTLRARLNAEATSFSDVLDAERKAFAFELMNFADAKLAAIAAQAGFSDAAAFTRAFRRWTGTTPKAWLQDQAQKGGALAAEAAQSGA